MGSTTADAALDVLERAHRGDTAAVAELMDEHLHPAWRIAVVAAPNETVALGVVARGFCEGLAAAHRAPDATRSLRARIVAAVRHAACHAPAIDALSTRSNDPVLVAFFALPEKSRTALWLREVEGGAPEQIAPILGLSRSEAAAVADRAWIALRDRLAADLAASAADVECRRALGRLGAHAAGKLTEADRAKVEEHLAGCGSCALALASLVTPRPALRRAVPALPAALPLAVQEAWAAHLAAEQRRGGISVWTERAVGAAAAAVIAVGLAGVALLGNRDRGGTGTEFAAPAGALEDAPLGGFGGAEGESAAGLPGTSTFGPTYVADGGSGGASSSSGTGTRSGGGGSPAPRPRAGDDDDPTTGLPKTPPPATPTTPTAPSDPNPPGTPGEPSAPPDAEQPLPQLPLPQLPVPQLPATGTQIDLGTGNGTVDLSVGDCTGITLAGTTLGCTAEAADDSTEAPPVVIGVQVPGLPPIHL